MEYRDLCARLADCEREAGGAPLVCVSTAADPGPASYGGAGEHAPEWEADELTEEEGEGEEVGGREEVVAAAEAASPEPWPAEQEAGAAGRPDEGSSAVAGDELQLAARQAAPRSGAGWEVL